MQITFLGTGTSQGVPMVACTCATCSSVNTKDKRLRTSVLIEIQNHFIAIDTGPDFRTQMLREQVKNLHAVLFTHEHKDHTAGLDDVRAYNYFMECAMPVYGSEHCLKMIQQDFGYIFSGKNYPGIPEVQLNPIENAAFEIHLAKSALKIMVTPIAVMHYKLPVFGYRIGDFSYITDANSIADNELEKLKGSKILVLNALRHEPHISHFTLLEAIEIAKKVGAEKTYFTHISHQLGMHDEISATLPPNMFLAYDGLKLQMD